MRGLDKNPAVNSMVQSHYQIEIAFNVVRKSMNHSSTNQRCTKILSGGDLGRRSHLKPYAIFFLSKECVSLTCCVVQEKVEELESASFCSSLHFSRGDFLPLNFFFRSGLACILTRPKANNQHVPHCMGRRVLGGALSAVRVSARAVQLFGLLAVVEAMLSGTLGTIVVW